MTTEFSSFPKPRVLVSRCLGFEACRWNGLKIDDPLVESLKPFAEFIDVCPECGVGLGVPRHPVRIVESPAGPRLLQPASGEDFTERMLAFSREFLSSAGPLDGAILKFKSPSCGLSNVKLYKAIDKGESFAKAAGFFGGALKAAFPLTPAEDEGRLKNFLIREHFLTRLFLGARLRKLGENGSAGALVEFHSRCKYLLMAFSQTGLRKLGRLVAEGGKRPFPELFAEYSSAFFDALAKPVKEGSAVNALQHMAGYFSKGLNAKEKAYFIDLLEDYLRGGTPLSVPLGVLKAWALRFEEKYILEQFFLRPYPDALLFISDSGKGRDF